MSVEGYVVSKDRSGNCVVAVNQTESQIRDTIIIGDSHSITLDVHEARAVAKAILKESHSRVHDVPRAATPKEAASIPNRRPPSLNQRKKILAKRMAKK